MVPQYSAWNPSRHGSPKKESPGFQREWKPVESSGVLLESNGTGLSNAQVLIQPPSGTDTSGTVYLWGISFASESTSVNGGLIVDDSGEILTVAVGSAYGPMFLQLSTPIKVPINSGVKYQELAYQAGSYITCYYTVSHQPYDEPDESGGTL